MEMNGFIALSILVLGLLVIRYTMTFWVPTKTDALAEKKLTEAWEQYKNNAIAHPYNNQNDPSKDYEDANDEASTPLPSINCLNSVDSSTLVRYKGIGPKTAAKIIHYRERHNGFKSKNELVDSHLINKNVFENLTNHFRIDSCN